MIIKQLNIVNQGVININYGNFKHDAKKVNIDNENALTVSGKAMETIEEILKKFEVKKFGNLKLEKAYCSLDMLAKAERVNLCASVLEFWVDKEYSKLIRANFCRDRLCPSCAWRRSMKTYAENRSCFDKLSNKGRFLFLTLTCKNVIGEELANEITAYLDGFITLFRRKDIKRHVLGLIRALEVTYNEKDKTYHPHIHCLIHVDNEYFSRGYITQDDWRRNWKEIMNLNYLPKVHITVFKPKTKAVGKELAEISKYCVKFSNILKLDDIEFKDVISILDVAFYRRRLISYSGTFRKVRKDLKLTDDIGIDIEDGEEDKCDEGYKVIYKWHYGQQKYEKI